jgi:hypothetical protein
MSIPVQAADQEKSVKEKQKDQVYKRTSEAIKAIDNHPRNRKIYGIKKLYENDDVIIFRGFDKDGRRYTFTKRK